MTLFLQFDEPTDRWEIWVEDNRMRPCPAGGGGRWKFAHDTHAEAEVDRLKAQAYLDELGKTKQSKKELKGAGA